MSSDYDYDDPERERGAVVNAFREHGLPAVLAAGLLDDAEREDGLDPIDACRQTNGDLALLLSPDFAMLMARAVHDDDTPTRGRLQVLVGRALDHVSADDLAEAQLQHEDSMPDFSRDEMAALVKKEAAGIDAVRIDAAYFAHRRQGQSGFDAWQSVYSDVKRDRLS